MCEPTTIALISAAASAAGTVVQTQAADEARDKQDRIRNGEMIRQDTLLAEQKRREQEGRALTDAMTPKFAAESQKNAQTDIAAATEQQIAPDSADEIKAAAYLPENPGAPTEVKDKLAATLADAIGKGKQHAKNRARLSAFGELGTNNQLGLQRTATDISAINADINRLQRSGAQSLSRMGADLQVAGRPDASSMALADVFNGIGQAGSLYSSTRPKTKVVDSSMFAG